MAGPPPPPSRASFPTSPPPMPARASCVTLGSPPCYDGRNQVSRGGRQLRAAIFRNGEIVVGTLPEPKPAAGQALVKTLACGICGSDLHARKHARHMVGLARHFPGRKPMDLSRDVWFGHQYCCGILAYWADTQS